MSKTISEQVVKAQTLVSGLRKQWDLVKGKGLDDKYLKELEEGGKELQACDEAVEKIRMELHERIKETNEKLIALKEKMLVARKTVKMNFSQEQWVKFGVTDKRL